MPITYSVDAQLGLMTTTISGRVDANDLRANALATGDDPDVLGAEFSIVDLTDVTEIVIDASVVASLAMSERANTRRVAIVAPTDPGYGLARVYQGFRPQSSTMPMMVFRARADALRWLGIAEPAPKPVH
jgi:hypothetical protein